MVPRQLQVLRRQGTTGRRPRSHRATTGRQHQRRRQQPRATRHQATRRKQATLRLATDSRRLATTVLHLVLPLVQHPLVHLATMARPRLAPLLLGPLHLLPYPGRLQAQLHRVQPHLLQHLQAPLLAPPLRALHLVLRLGPPLLGLRLLGLPLPVPRLLAPRLVRLLPR